jgi:hypothetical protein
MTDLNVNSIDFCLDIISDKGFINAIETPVSIKSEKFLGEMYDYKLLMNESIP